jgi:hypothetical protein
MNGRDLVAEEALRRREFVFRLDEASLGSQHRAESCRQTSSVGVAASAGGVLRSCSSSVSLTSSATSSFWTPSCRSRSKRRRSSSPARKVRPWVGSNACTGCELLAAANRDRRHRRSACSWLSSTASWRFWALSARH